MPSFIGTPGGVNLYDPEAVASGISSWTGPMTPEQVARLPWNAGVQPAGAALDLPGARAGLDFQEATGVDINKLREERNLAVAGLKGLPGEVPARAVEAIDRGYEDALARFVPIVQAGVDPAETIRLLIEPLRNQTQALHDEYKYRQPRGGSSLPQPFVRQPGMDYVTAGGALIPAAKEKPQPIPAEIKTALSAMEKEWVKAQYGSGSALPDLDKASKIAQSIESTRQKWGISSAPVSEGGNASSSSLREGQRVRNRRTGQMGTVINGVVVPD